MKMTSGGDFSVPNPSSTCPGSNDNAHRTTLNDLSAGDRFDRSCKAFGIVGAEHPVEWLPRKSRAGNHDLARVVAIELGDSGRKGFASKVDAATPPGQSAVNFGRGIGTLADGRILGDESA